MEQKQTKETKISAELPAGHCGSGYSCFPAACNRFGVSESHELPEQLPLSCILAVEPQVILPPAFGIGIRLGVGQRHRAADDINSASFQVAARTSAGPTGLVTFPRSGKPPDAPRGCDFLVGGDLLLVVCAWRSSVPAMTTTRIWAEISYRKSRLSLRERRHLLLRSALT